MALFKFLLLSTILQLAATDLIPFDDWLYQRVALPDVNIYFRYAGTGPPVLLVHGYPEHSVGASKITHLLVEGHRLTDLVSKAYVAYDWTNSSPELYRHRC